MTQPGSTPAGERRPFFSGGRRYLTLAALFALIWTGFLWSYPGEPGGDLEADPERPQPAVEAPSTLREPVTPPAHPDAATRPERLRIEVVATHPHDPAAFTQGLLWHGGKLFESTGQYGLSSLRRVDLESGEVEQLYDLPAELFGEGLARVGDRLVQLTYHEAVAPVYDLESFGQVEEFTYEGEGWGLCFDGARLVMSNGSDRLTFRDPQTFTELGRVRVTMGEAPLSSLNELECVGGQVWANVWPTELLVRIDPESGRVTATADASHLLSPLDRSRTDVLNGIAYRPETETFLLTGKYWPTLFEVRFLSRDE